MHYSHFACTCVCVSVECVDSIGNSFIEGLCVHRKPQSNRVANGDAMECAKYVFMFTKKCEFCYQWVECFKLWPKRIGFIVYVYFMSPQFSGKRRAQPSVTPVPSSSFVLGGAARCQRILRSVTVAIKWCLYYTCKFFVHIAAGWTQAMLYFGSMLNPYIVLAHEHRYESGVLKHPHSRSLSGRK